MNGPPSPDPGPKSRGPSSNCIVCAALVSSPHRIRSNRACSKRVLQKGSHNDCNQEDAFSSGLVSHSKGSLRVYFFSSGSICALAGGLARRMGSHGGCIWRQDTILTDSLASLFHPPNSGISKYLGTLVQLFRVRTSDVIAQSDPHRARKG